MLENLYEILVSSGTTVSSKNWKQPYNNAEKNIQNIRELFEKLGDYVANPDDENLQGKIDKIAGLRAKQLKEIYNQSGLTRILGAVGKPDKIFMKLGNTVVALSIMEWLLTDWYNKYKNQVDDTTVDGTLPPDQAFINLRTLLFYAVLLSNLTKSDEVLELFTEGVSNAIGEILERQLIGGLAIQSALRYGSRELDPDSISEACEGRSISELYHCYETLLSGAYNTTAKYTYAKGKYRTLQEMCQALHQDLFFYAYKSLEGWNIPADTLLDNMKKLYEERIISPYSDLDSGIKRYRTELQNTIAYVESRITMLLELRTEGWAQYRHSTKRSYNQSLYQHLAKLTQIFIYDVYSNAVNWDCNLAVANTELQELIQKHDSMRQQMMNQLIEIEQDIYNRIGITVKHFGYNVNNVRMGGLLRDYSSDEENEEFKTDPLQNVLREQQ